jgi:hypothetical protein
MSQDGVSGKQGTVCYCPYQQEMTHASVIIRHFHWFIGTAQQFVFSSRDK